jgi:hypothetical protein
VCGDGELCVGELEALGDGVGVFEQDLPLASEPQSAGPAVEQPGADLAFQRADLVGDRRLRQGELAGGARERAFMHHGTEGEHAPRIHSHRRGVPLSVVHLTEVDTFGATSS